MRDPNPSFNRGFVEPALNAFGRRRLRTALLDVLTTGPDPERAGAARAWYWSALPLRMRRVVAEEPAGAPEPDDPSVLAREWNELALREFVRNEHLDVRRCILPLLPLRHSSYPPQLHELVDEAVAVARNHPDVYLRHRVEIQWH
ncbi:hypothetical protein [Actinacidiphila bryophytorum]|uniref:hypothetical protein n=1 Tax=Actinacidiphila bryophytorum TaxID=1436133 RepID=UPI002176BE17|nr:hypothetical protein [Actinacidiphila bryophytorum]UWE10177.1 hypothetical protein NYE86_16625 [Actinacidiphila bryophytorum]